MFPATVLVAVLTKFDVGVTLLTSGLGTIVALLVTRRRIPMYYGSSFSYIAVVVTTMSLYAGDCFRDPARATCPEGVRLVQVGILGTAALQVVAGVLVIRLGRAALDRVLPPVLTGSVAVVIGVALAGAALGMAGRHWPVAFLTLAATVLCAVYLRGRGLLGMLPVLLGAAAGYLAALALGLVDLGPVARAAWLRWPAVTLPALGDGRAWGALAGIALIAVATIPESTAHLYQLSLYVDALARELGRPPPGIRRLIGLNLVADGADDLVAGCLGGCAGTNYGENNSLMAITRTYSVAVLMAAGGLSVLLALVGKLAALVHTLPVPVTGGLAIFLFGVIGMQGIALIQSERVDLFEPRQLAVGATVLILGIGGSLALPDGLFPFRVPALFPAGIPAIVFASLAGLLLNLVFVLAPPPAAAPGPA
jgi:uracil permease